MKTSFYQILEIPYNASPEEIRSAYFEAARRFHPDVNPDPFAKQKFLQIQEAYEVLSNPKKRAAYDEQLPAEFKELPAVDISITYGRSQIPLLDEPQLFYVLVELETPKQPDPKYLPPVHICLVLDRSNSMRGERIEMVRQNIILLTKKLRPKDRLSLVAFSDRAEVILPPKEMEDIAIIEGVLNKIQVGGATEIFQGLSTGYDLIQRFSREGMIKQLILITDGHTYGDEQNCIDLAAQARIDGVPINALGIGDEWNDTFLDQIASVSGGNAIYINKSEDLTQFIESKMRSISVSYARKIEWFFNLNEGIELRYVFRIHPDITPLGNESPIPLGTIEYGKKTSIILEFKLPALKDKPSEIQLLKGFIQMQVPSLANPFARYAVNLSRQIRENWQIEKPPTSILQAMSKITLYRLQEKARLEVQSGDIGKATRHLQHLATHLLAQGDRELAKTVLVEADHIQRTHSFSKEGDKKIKYGTRALFLLPSSTGREL
ncbi:MAG: VWA domain-containing protein [Chloroflexota bacterium]